MVTLLPHPGIRNTMLSIIAQGSLEEWSALLSTIFTSLQHSISSTVEFIMLRLQQLNRDGFFPLTLTITDVIRIYQATDGKQPDGATNLHQWRQMLLTAQAKLQSLSLGYDPDILCRLYLPASTGREFFIHCNKVTVFIEDVIALQQQTPLFVEDQFTQLLELVHRHGLVIGQAFVKQIRDWQEENLLEVENEFSISYLLKLTRQLLQQNSTNEK
ncbi:MAG: hypothetical protein HWD59_08660 [Coxiellaceae bacterium]|nr:MAG: hypothetical protein HWD59_08660 [Coxiellaceae bacterium]